MSKKKIKDPSLMLKQTAMLFVICAFVLGFLAGVGFTVYKTNSESNIASPKGPEIDYEQREKLLKAEVKKNQDNTAAWIQLGHVYFDTDQYQKAIDAYKKALQLDPRNADVLTDLGIIYRRSGQPQKAIESFDQAVVIDPKHETARFNKGIVLMHDLKDQNGAIKAWEELLEINPLAMVGDNQSVDQLIKHYKEGHENKKTN
jgi:cytochrome c-type biogenesis protein CcmH/NrfG